MLGPWFRKVRPMREEILRSLLLVDSDPAERRLVSATASRAGWSVVTAADNDSAAGLLQGPHGREVRAALLSSWRAETSPGLIAAMRITRTYKSLAIQLKNQLKCFTESSMHHPMLTISFSIAF